MVRLNAFTKASTLLLTMNLAFFTPQSEAATVLSVTDMGTNISTSIATAADNNNNIVTVFPNGELIQSRYSPGNGLWEPNVTISDAILVKDFPDVAMDATSTALAVWIGNFLGDFTVESNRLSGGLWELPVVLEGPTTDELLSPSVAMNGSGGGVAAWINNTSGRTHASFYNAGAWTPFQDLGDGDIEPKTAYSPIGNAAAVWGFSGDSSINASTSVGFVWQTTIQLDLTADGPPDVGMDASGNAIAVWLGNDPNFDVKWSRFDGLAWSPAAVLSLASGNFDPKIAVAPNGTAIAVWPDAGNNIQISQFNGTVWSVPAAIAPGTSASITMDSLGNALIGWISSFDEIFNAYLPLGGILSPPALVTTASEDLFSLDLALSSASKTGVTAWHLSVPLDEENFTFAALTLFQPLPSGGITGSVCSNNFATQVDRVHIISWAPSTDPTTVSYYIYRNGALISIVPVTGPFTYYDHNRCKGTPDTYVVVAVDAQGIQSAPVSITLD